MARFLWLACLFAHPALAAPGGNLCVAAITRVEHETALPPRLLAAIGLVESGRRDPRDRLWQPWPWTIDVAGQSAFFDTKQAAMAAVRAWQQAGVQSIDVGCMQVNLAQHPQAFATLDEAFDPLANVRYAARFLDALFARSGNWPVAAGLYHSATPGLGSAYRRRVVAVWSDAPAVATARRPDVLARAWAATLLPQD